jgi:hypothetical protein
MMPTHSVPLIGSSQKGGSIQKQNGLSACAVLQMIDYFGSKTGIKIL